MRKSSYFLYENMDFKLNGIQNFNSGDFGFHYTIVMTTSRT